MISPRDFIEQVVDGRIKRWITNTVNPIQLGKVDPNYVSGRPSVIFDGETSLSKPYPYLSSYAPQANDRVLVVKGVVVGKII